MSLNRVALESVEDMDSALSSKKKQRSMMKMKRKMRKTKSKPVSSTMTMRLSYPPAQKRTIGAIVNSIESVIWMQRWMRSSRRKP